MYICAAKFTLASNRFPFFNFDLNSNKELAFELAFKREVMTSIWKNLLTQFENPSIISRNGIFFIRL